MIGRLKGVVDGYAEDHVVIDVGGVGYAVHCSSRTLQRLPPLGEATMLTIETHVREDMIRLYGFLSEAERDWFRLCQTVQGVGAKVALGLLSVMDPGQLASAVATGDKAQIARAPGIGPKLAARFVAELKDKAPVFAQIDPVLARLSGQVDSGTAPSAVTDAISALVNLGYPQMQASAAVAAAIEKAGDAPETRVLIRLGLRELAR